MASRRQFLCVAGASLGLAPVFGWLGGSGLIATPMTTKQQFPDTRTDEDWQRELSPEQYQVLRHHGTERAFTSPLNHEKRPGTFVCAGCGQPLFEAATKYDSGTGWPSFYEPLPDAVGTSVDRSWAMIRTEVHCARCGGHLGHLFPDGPQPTGQRYCINGVALKFVPQTR